MKTADIKVGETYTFRRYSYATPPQAARVVETGVPVEVGYSYRSRKTVKNGVRVVITGHKGEQEEVVTSRQIGPEIWSEYKAEQAAEFRRQQAEERRQGQIQRLAEAKQIESALEGHGVESGGHYIGRGARSFYEQAGFVVEESTFGERVKARFDVVDYVGMGTIDEDVVRVLLASIPEAQR